eukprot:2593845-Alexandrium_andersonii.AAC.1
MVCALDHDAVALRQAQRRFPALSKLFACHGHPVVRTRVGRDILVRTAARRRGTVGREAFRLPRLLADGLAGLG